MIHLYRKHFLVKCADFYKIFFKNKFIALLAFLFITFNINAQTKAFPEAEGFGKNAIGGRGGVVYKVTNLNNSGAGSLRAACEASGPRTVVFEVSGTINLTSNLVINNDFLTIAGQTAPGDGICLRGSSFIVSASDVIIRYIRFRLGDNGYKNASGNVVGPNSADSDTVGVQGSTGRTQNVIFDHCSMSWSIDELVGIYGSTNPDNGINNLTFQYCIFSEALYASHHGDGSHSMAFLINQNSKNISIYKNLFAHSSERHVRSGGGCSFEMINNVVYNYRYSCVVSASNEFTMINNHYKEGSLSPVSSYLADYTSQTGFDASLTKAYVSGNTNDSNLTQIDPALNAYLQSTPYINSGIVADPVSSSIDDVLNNAGAILPSRDIIDERIVNSYLNNNGNVIDTQAQVGGYPTYNSTTPLQDSDNDGMPNSWEQTNGLDINDPNDRNILQPDGYTNLEYYLNGMSLDVDDVIANAGNDETICQGESMTLTATGGSTYLWSTGATTASIIVNPNTTTTYTVTAYSVSGNNSDTDDVTVTVNTPPTAIAGDDVSTCLGTAVTLTASGGSSYLWSNGATTPSINVNPNTTTTYSVEVTQNGCSSTDQVIVTVNSLPNINAGNDVTIFSGESVTLSASGGTSYIWNTGETTQSINVSPTVTTTYTVAGSANGCEDVDEVTVIVQTDDVTANAGQDVAICQGENVTLTASGGTTYLWNTGATTASITVNPNSTSTYTVTAYSISGNNSDSDEVTVTVNTPPTANAGSDVEICQGTAVTLTASGGSSYFWSNGATTQSINVNPNTTTTYSVEVTQNGCSSTDQVIVTVNPLPTINAGNDVTIFSGESVTLSAFGGSSYFWNNGETTQNITVSPTTTTTYTVTGTANGCQNTDSVTVIVQTDDVTANAGEDVAICQGENVTLIASGGATYQWNTGATTASIIVNPNTTTTYTVTAYSVSGNNSDTDDVTITVNTPPTANAGDDVSTCQGTALTLTASGGTSYVWNTGATTASITVNPNSTTTYSVEVTQNGCSSTDQVIVTVNPLPTINAGNDVTIFTGESVTLSATGGTSYVWNTGATTQNITVSPTATTTYTVTGTANGCQNTDSVTVFVQNQTVTANAGENQNICQGDSTTLTASGGDTYLWSTGATTQSITVNPNATSTYTVTAFIGNVQDSDDVTVSVSPNPNVNIINGAEVTILEGEFITLSATGANTYLWNNGATQPNIAVSPSNNTTYSVTGYINNCEDQKEVQVNVLERVSAGIDGEQSVCLNESIVLTAISNTYAEFLWNTGETTQSITVSPAEDTEYSVTVYNALDYDTAEMMVIVTDCTVINPEEPESFEFLVYPNPTSGELNIKINGLINVADIYLYDVSGKSLYYEKINEDEQQSYIKQLNVSNFASGIYFLKLVDNTTVITKKIIVN